MTSSEGIAQRSVLLVVAVLIVVAASTFYRFINTLRHAPASGGR
jgi:hypothetical protein